MSASSLRTFGHLVSNAVDREGAVVVGLATAGRVERGPVEEDTAAVALVGGLDARHGRGEGAQFLVGQIQLLGHCADGSASRIAHTPLLEASFASRRRVGGQAARGTVR